MSVGNHDLRDPMGYADQWCAADAPEPERVALARLFARCQRDTIERAAQVADKWATYYPVKAFPEHGESLDCRAAHHGRHSSKVIAEDIRKLTSEDA